MDLGLADRIAIVTGSSRGLGFACAAALVREGCRVTVCARGAEKLAESEAELNRLATEPGRVLAVVADVATADGVGQVVADTLSRFGGLDILVNNVGTARGAGITDTSDAEWQLALDQTLFPAVRASRLAVPHMKQRGGGSIVMIASIWGRESGGRMTYNAVKAAEIRLAKALSQQLAPGKSGVRGVGPGRIMVPGGAGHGGQRAIAAEMADRMKGGLPFG